MSESLREGKEKSGKLIGAVIISGELAEWFRPYLKSLSTEQTGGAK